MGADTERFHIGGGQLHPGAALPGGVVGGGKGNAIHGDGTEGRIVIVDAEGRSAAEGDRLVGAGEEHRAGGLRGDDNNRAAGGGLYGSGVGGVGFIKIAILTNGAAVFVNMVGFPLLLVAAACDRANPLMPLRIDRLINELGMTVIQLAAVTSFCMANILVEALIDLPTGPFVRLYDAFIVLIFAKQAL